MKTELLASDLVIAKSSSGMSEPSILARFKLNQSNTCAPSQAAITKKSR